MENAILETLDTVIALMVVLLSMGGLTWALSKLRRWK